ncbi:HTH-type transcriptional activator CmpR [Sulfitobacter sp. THAF37]|uniref:LysR family transcriptional regulator n=1 Tax=Sulfitobacter sp. THAF37 TaxID=2587855 RepID=UPI00126864DA|nr:LysR family transcriptional regulator [Sulfitobacter sp. THAF37]QFT57347.1 HTH-type transcriptional activator CmpR [Sulfitobacter sp. THAF37]
MNFTLKQLLYFDAARRNRSIARAAAEMNISQSSITAAVDQIEQSVGVELFRRIPAKGVVPTRMGDEVGRHISGFLEQARLFQSDMMSLGGNPTGTLRLGCFEPTAPYVLPPLLRRISDGYPEIRIDLMEGDMEQMSDVLQTGAVDAALTYEMEVRPEHSFVPLFEAPPYALVPESSHLAHRTELSLQDLVDVPMVALDVPRTRGYFQRLFKNAGLTPTVVHSTKSGAVLRGLIAAQFGHGILNICSPADRDPTQGYLSLPIVAPVENPVFGIAYAPQLENSAVVRAVIDTASELAAEGGFDHLSIASR